MSNVFFTADHHFSHDNIIKYCNRPFSSVEEMDEIMIQKWNEIVTPEDDVYYLGDFTLSGYINFSRIFRRLNAHHVVFIPGSHDHRWITEYYQSHTIDLKILIGKELHSLPITSKLPIVMCHYAMRVWDRSHYGSYHLYGHSHGNLPGLGRSMDVGVDTNNFYPYAIEEILDKLNKIEPHNAVK